MCGREKDGFPAGSWLIPVETMLLVYSIVLVHVCMCVCNILYIYLHIHTVCPLYLISLFCSRRKNLPNAVLQHWCLVFDRRRCWKHKDVCLAQNIEGFHCPRSLRRFLLQRSCLFDDSNQTLGPSPSLMSRFSQMLWHLKPLTTLPKPRAYILPMKTDA